MNTSTSQQTGVKKVAPRLRGQRVAPNPQLFEDTSMQHNAYGYPPTGMEFDNADHMYDQTASYDSSQAGSYGGVGVQASSAPYLGQQLLTDPMANMAVHYGQTLADQGSEMIHKNLEKYVSSSRLKYYFAVDTSYVGKKLGLLMFPFVRSDWSMHFDTEQPVAPRYETNAPDLYIPVMSFVTYILLAGIVLGTQNRFSPEQLGITASTALVWTTIEILLLLLSLYIMNISANLTMLDLLSYCGYKYVGMIVILAVGLVFQSMGYYLALGWTSLSIAYFLVKSLRVVLMSQANSESFIVGNKRRLYMLLVIALTQPLLMWWLTRRLIV